ncbi:MAG: 50S ribosomal protein L6 [Gammaproteobacteria bacterium]
MSRVAKQPVELSKEIEVTLDKHQLSVKGPKGALQLNLHHLVQVSLVDGEDPDPQRALQFAAKGNSKFANALAGTHRALANNMVVGVSQGFEKQLNLVGVGYRAQVQGKKLTLHLGFSHPIVYPLPEGVDVETPSNTIVLVKAADKQVLGQVCAEIRAFRPPEPYKGKGVCYAGERIIRKETKKK